jgi:hypothetical protein
MSQSPLDAAEFSRRLVDCAVRNGEAGITGAVADTFLASITAASQVLVVIDAPRTVALGNALYKRMVSSTGVTDAIP